MTNNIHLKINTFKNSFIIFCCSVFLIINGNVYYLHLKGDNILFVGICGPKGQQCDEIYIKHMGKNIYNIYYRVHEMGDYAIVIRYGKISRIFICLTYWIFR